MPQANPDISGEWTGTCKNSSSTYTLLELASLQAPRGRFALGTLESQLLLKFGFQGVWQPNPYLYGFSLFLPLSRYLSLSHVQSLHVPPPVWALTTIEQTFILSIFSNVISSGFLSSASACQGPIHS